MNHKILNDSSLIKLRKACNKSKKRLIVTNGCFDILHIGHINYLQKAKKLGDILLVGINSDTSVKRNKGKKRPINNEKDRAMMLAAIECVDAVYIYKEKTALNFLQKVIPDIYVKGGDYTINTINYEERLYLQNIKAKIKILPLIKNKSTTKLIEKILANA